MNECEPTGSSTHSCPVNIDPATCESLSGARTDAFHAGNRESWIRVGGLFGSPWVPAIQVRLTLRLDLLGSRSWTYLESLSASRSSSGLVLWTGGTWYVPRDVFVIYIHFVCWLVCCLFLSFGNGVIPSVPHSLWPGEFCPSVPDVVCYEERERERGRGIIIGLSSFMLFVWGYKSVVNRMYKLCV
jgi:hypothetical protein